MRKLFLTSLAILVFAGSVSADQVVMCKLFPRSEAKVHLKKSLLKSYGSSYATVKLLLDAGMRDYDYLCSLPNNRTNGEIISRLADSYYPNFSTIKMLYEADMKAYRELQK